MNRQASPESQPHNRRRTVLLALAKFVVSIAAFWLVLRAVDFHQLLQQFSAADPFWIGLGLLALIAHFAAIVWRWNYALTRFYGLRLGLRRLSLVVGIGEAVGPALPSFVGTDVVRTFALAGTASLVAVAKAVLIDRVLGLVALLVMIALSVPFFAALIEHGPALALVAALSFGGLIAYGVGLQAAPFIARIPIFGGSLAKLVIELRRVASDRRAMALLIVSGLLVHLTSILTFWCAARMLHGTIGLVPALLITPAAMLVASVPVSIGGWGLREGALVTGFALIGADPENILAASICYGLSGLVTGIIGVASLPFLPRDPGSPAKK